MIETPKGIPYTAEVTDIVRGESQVSCAVVKDGGSCWDIGYCIHPTCWRKGYAKEMVNALVQFGAQNGIKTVLADVAAENAGSCGVMRALGFTPTENGTFRRSGSQTEYGSGKFPSKKFRPRYPTLFHVGRISDTGLESMTTNDADSTLLPFLATYTV